MPKAKATTTNADKKVEDIVIPELKVEIVTFKIHGTSPLIPHKWSEKAKKEMLDKQQKKASQGREAKDPVADFRESLYIIPSSTEKIKATLLDGSTLEIPGVLGMTPLAFKKAAVGAANDAGMHKTLARRAFHVNLGEELIPIETPGPVLMREDMGRTSTGVALLIYRGGIFPWSTELKVQYNSRIISKEQLANLFHLAGFGVGVGDWRSSRDGQFGMFSMTATVSGELEDDVALPIAAD